MAFLHMTMSDTGIVHLRANPLLNGKNKARHKWADVLSAVGVIGRTCMTVGDKPGCITQTEADDILAGKIVEVQVRILPESCNADEGKMRKAAEKQATDWLTAQKAPLEWYGLTIGE